MKNNEEQLLREFIRHNMVKPLVEKIEKEKKQEVLIRKWARSFIMEQLEKDRCTVISEGKDVANPHPNTGINKLRDSIRKAKPSIKAKFQQLTSDVEQRESFTNHFLAAFVRLFDQLDALSASADEAEVDAVDSEIGLPASGEGSSLEGDALSAGGLEAPPEDVSSDELGSEIEGLLEGLLLEEDEDEIPENDIVSAELGQEKEKDKKASQVEKDVEKKKAQDAERSEFSAGVGGDTTGRNQSFDTFNLVQSYFSDAYLDLDRPEDKEMYKKWALYNLKLLLDSYEEELSTNLEQPEIENPQ